MAAAGLHINDLPDLVLLEIFSHLDQVTIHLSISRVCKRWDSLSYEGKLWKEFDQKQFIESFNCFINTRSFVKSTLRRIHSCVKYLSLTEQGLVLLPFLEHLGLPSLKKMYLAHSNKKNDDTIASCIINIQRETSAKIYLYYSKFKRIPVRCGDSIYSDSSGKGACGFEDDLHCPLLNSLRSVVEWEIVNERLHLNPNRATVLFYSQSKFRNFRDTIPLQTIYNLVHMTKLQHLEFESVSLQDLMDLPDDEMNHLTRNLLSLTLHSCVVPEMALVKMISNASLLQKLQLDIASSSIITTIASCCSELSSLELWNASPIGRKSFDVFQIAYHCTKLETLSLRYCYLKLHSFLKLLARRCKSLVYLNLECTRKPDDENGKTDCLNQLLAGCSKLRSITINRGSLKIAPLQLEGKFSLEKLILTKSIAEIPKDSLSAIQNLEVLHFNVEEISVEFIRKLSETCTVLKHLELSERNNDIKCDLERGSTLLDQIYLKLVNHVSLLLKNTLFHTESVENFIFRSEYLSYLKLSPLLPSPQSKVDIGNIPHRSRFINAQVAYELKVLPGIRWRELAWYPWQEHLDESVNDSFSSSCTLKQ